MAEKYKFMGAKDRSQNVNRLIIEGSVANPKTVIKKGDVIELSDDEVAAHRASGMHFLKASDNDVENSTGSGEKSDKEKLRDQSEAQASNVSNPAAPAVNDTNVGGRAAGKKS